MTGALLAVGWGLRGMAGNLAVLLAMLVVAAVCHRVLRLRPLQPAAARRDVRAYEWRCALLTLLVGGVITTITVASIQRGLITLRLDPASPATVLGEFALYFVCYDLYAYGTHWLLHRPPLFRLAHRVHHRSVRPNPVTTYSSHPIEATMTGSFLLLFMLSVPLHLTSVFVMSGFAVTNSLLAHLGFDPFPSWWHRARLTRWYVTPRYHDAHHATGVGNLGFYTTLWDRVFGTIRPEFDPRAGVRTPAPDVTFAADTSYAAQEGRSHAQ
ncbi:MAG TPA: sterol desaturase family protein [Candidatus Binatia bacterium]|jgi:sterol desaturase/sphingolipid hydroxylase (fatty acid hydroxylase superfamily)|nr:sterol desaturase family protein [Candidatus Binatia bacterium]